MVDFTGSFQKGIAAAKDAEKNRLEIASVFDEMNAQLAAATDGKIEIIRREIDEPANLLGGVTLASLFQKKTYWALCVRNKGAKELAPLQIARWRQDSAGYPCWITTPSAEVACENKEGLEQGLSGLISSPDAGELIYRALNFVPKT